MFIAVPKTLTELMFLAKLAELWITDVTVSSGGMPECSMELTAIVTIQFLKRCMRTIFGLACVGLGTMRACTCRIHKIKRGSTWQWTWATSASVFCHRLTTHQTHQNPSKIVTLLEIQQPSHVIFENTFDPLKRLPLQHT